MDVETFFDNAGPTTFIDRVAAVLGIPLNTIRVVSIAKGSTIINFWVDSQYQNNSNPALQQLANDELNNFENELNQAANNGSLNILGGTMMSFNTTVTMANQTAVSAAATSTSSSVPTLPIVLGVSISVVAILIVLAIVFTWKKRKVQDKAKVHEEPAKGKIENYRVADQNPSPQGKEDYARVSDASSNSVVLSHSHTIRTEDEDYGNKLILMPTPAFDTNEDMVPTLFKGKIINRLVNKKKTKPATDYSSLRPDSPAKQGAIEVEDLENNGDGLRSVDPLASQFETISAIKLQPRD